MLAASMVAACFQPLYGDRSVTGGSALREALAAVAVDQIVAAKGTPLARIAVETRNELLFDLTGGGGSAAPTHKLTIKLIPSKTAIIIDRTTLRAVDENFGLDANYTLTELATGRTAVTGSAVTRVTYNIPGEQQRFARERGLRDAETRAAKQIADQIRSRLASYFVAGT
jgi:LPS-assembly lipoprotein